MEKGSDWKFYLQEKLKMSLSSKERIENGFSKVLLEKNYKING